MSDGPSQLPNVEEIPQASAAGRLGLRLPYQINTGVRGVAAVQV
jgi:hypothetical protein